MTNAARQDGSVRTAAKQRADSLDVARASSRPFLSAEVAASVRHDSGRNDDASSIQTTAISPAEAVHEVYFTYTTVSSQKAEKRRDGHSSGANGAVGRRRSGDRENSNEHAWFGCC